MRISTKHLTRSQLIARYDCSRTTAWRAAKRGWICVQREHPAEMNENDGRWVLAITAWIRDDDLRGNAILRLVELWGDVVVAVDREQYAVRIGCTEIIRRRIIRYRKLTSSSRRGGRVKVIR